MPAILTHDFFGRDAYRDVEAQLGFTSLDEHDAFLLGNQGPDPLFYLVADPRVSASNRVGSCMHCQRPALLIASLRDALTMLTRSERSIGEAYAAGFLCHYLLDCSVHPLVYAHQYALCDAGVDGLDRSSASYVHAEIERDLDEMVLFCKTHQTVRDFKPYAEVLQARDEVLACIDKLYFYMALWTYSKTLDLDCYTRAVGAFRRVQRLFYSPKRTAAKFLGTLERQFGHKPYSLYCAMSHTVRAEDSSVFANEEHKVWIHPFTGAPQQASFWDLYQRAREQVSASVTRFMDNGFELAQAEELTHNLNFSGQLSLADAIDNPHEPQADDLRAYAQAVLEHNKH